MSDNTHEIVFTLDIFGNSDGYFWSVFKEEKPKWRVNRIVDSLGRGQCESLGEALGEVRKIIELHTTKPAQGIDAAPSEGVE